MRFRKNMNENHQPVEHLMKDVCTNSDFEKLAGEVKNFGQLYKLIDRLACGLAGDDGKVYSSAELRGLVEDAVESTKSSGMIDTTRLVRASKALADKFPNLVEQWYVDNIAMELDA